MTLKSLLRWVSATLAGVFLLFCRPMPAWVFSQLTAFELHR
jgi:hypothetical protein